MAGREASRFRHEAFPYTGLDEFLAVLTRFVTSGLRAQQRVVVAVRAANSAALATELGRDAREVTFIDIETVGRNPGRLISLWQDALSLAGTDGLRGVGEPVWPGRTMAELVECHHLESLLGLAFGGDAHPGWHLLCPYDAVGLAPEVLAGARVTHPVVADVHGSAASTIFAADHAAALSDPLPDPPAETLVNWSFVVDDLPRLRRLVGSIAVGRVGAKRVTDLVTAVNEAATNSIRHGTGQGRLLAWAEPDRLVCEVSDRGWIRSPLVGRERPGLGVGGCGVWLMHQLCDLVQLRSSSAGTIVRLHVDLDQ